jgi:nitroreductase
LLGWMPVAIADTPPQTVDEVLSTTRAVRQRLDLNRPVDRAILRDCLQLAQQAPSPSNEQPWHFVFVTEMSKRAAIGAIYRELAETIMPRPETITGSDPKKVAGKRRVYRSARYLAEHHGEVPVHLIPCVSWRRDGPAPPLGAGPWASVVQASWSFMLAARARGLGTAWTTLHLRRERDIADLLGIPYQDVQQAALIPIAHTDRLEFRPGPRQPLEDIEHWDGW